MFKLNVCENIRASTIDIVDLYLWNKTHRYAPRIAVNANNLSGIGKEVHRREILEFERRFIENKTEVTFQQ